METFPGEPLPPIPAMPAPHRLTSLAWGFSAACVLVILLQASVPLWLSTASRARAVGQLAIVWEACLVVAVGLAAAGFVRKEPKAKATFIALAAVLAVLAAIVALAILSART
ncbi:MAG TPA: hypothetical protein VM286_06500 [Candidatus Thermoplasmatota archaeon]|nr:hypothetical protein [Candidatus Thermoplasmatota archaeon]